jgi:hypothetical protein
MMMRARARILGRRWCAILAGLLSLLGCARGPSVSEFSLSPRGPIRVGDSVQIEAVLDYPPSNGEFRWLAQGGYCDPQQSNQPATRYVAQQGGGNRITLQILRGGAVLHEAHLTIVVEEATEQTVAAAVNTPTAPGAQGEPAAQQPAGPRVSIEVSEIPLYDPVGGPESRGHIAGVVLGVAPTHRIVLYACTNICFVQPLIAKPFTDIGRGGKWANWTHTGTHYVVLVVGPEFDAPPTMPDPNAPLPGVISRLVVEGKR